MSETKFTPGPWEAKEATYDVEGDFKWWLYSPSYGSVGYWTGHKQRHEDSRWVLTKEDAHLIAAAPDLYEALMSLLIEYDKLKLAEDEPESMISEHRNAKQALAKARGEV